MKILKTIIVLLALTGCSKEKVENLGVVGVVQGKTTYISHTANSCILKMKYSVNGDAYNGQALPKNLFHFDSTGLIEGLNSSEYFTCETLKTDTIIKKLFPASIFVLVDKSVTSISQDFNQDQQIPFKQALFNNLVAHAGDLEVNFGACAANNPLAPEYQLSFTEFQQDISAIKADSVASAFNLNTNGGVCNLPVSISTTLDYINTHAHYNNRILMLFTDFNSGIPDNNYVTGLITKALANHVNIIVFNTFAPDRVLYSQRRFVNGTDGYQFHSIGANYLNTALYRNIETLFNIWNGQPVYESTVKLTTTGNFFNLNKYGLIDLRVNLFDFENSLTTPLYER